MQYYQPSSSYYYRGEDNRGLLLPLLVGAAVGFPFGYIASNTNKNNYNYPMPYPVYPQYPVYPSQPMPYPYSPYPYMPYYNTPVFFFLFLIMLDI